MKISPNLESSNTNKETLGIIAITDEPTFSFTLTPQIEKELDKARKSISKRKKDTIVELKKMIQKYPHVNTFYNFLALAYRDQGRYEEEYELIQATIKKFPTYLFGRITLLSFYVSTQNITELDKLLENVKSIKDYAPEKEVFHISEISSFYSAYLDYLAYKQETERIKNIWSLLEKLAQKFESLEDKMYTIKTRFSQILAASRMMKMQERLKSIVQIKATCTSSIQADADAELPDFNHEEVEELCFEFFGDMTQEKIDVILSLPKETVIEDLEAVLIYLQAAKESFYEDLEADIDVPFYAIDSVLNFLSALESKKSVPLILDMFRQDEEFIEFWFMDYLEPSHIVWVLYKFLENDFDTIANFVKEENNNNRSRIAIMSIPAQVALHQPKRRQEVVDFYKNLIHFFIQNKDNKKVIDHLVTTKLGSLAHDIQGKELRQDLVELSQAGLINGVINSIEDILEEIDTPFYSTFQDRKVNLNLSLREAYEKIENHQPFTYPKTEEEQKKSKEKSKTFLEGLENENEFFDIEDMIRSLVQPEEPSRPIPYQEKEGNKVEKFNSFLKEKTYQRNDKVSVKYTTGKVIVDTKYKKVEKDIQAGKCFVLDV
jgi:hypothetical protein